MTIANLGIAIQSGSAVTAAADLDKLVVSAGKAERGTAGVGRASRDLAGALAPMTVLLASIERNTATMATGLGRVTVATTQVQRAAVSTSAALTAEAGGFRSATEAMRQNTQAANENRAALAARNAVSSQYTGANNFNTANVAAQFQDIGVTAAMGMSPLQIALQQGTQLSAVLGGQGLTGVVRTLGAAFASILSPVSLLTIGAVALGATALQALGGMFQGAETATDALERHGEALDDILLGYDDVRDAADAALEAALKLPQESAQSNLGAQQAEATTRATAAMERALQLRQEFEGYVGYAEAFNVPAETISALESVNDVISDISADSNLSRQEIDQLHSSLTVLGNNSADQNIKDIVAEALALVDAARKAAAEVASLDAGLTAIDRDIRIRISMSQEFGNAFSDLQDMYQDPRSKFDVMREQAQNAADQAMATATSYGQAVGAAEEFQRVMASIDAAEATAAAKKAASARQSPQDRWETATGNFQNRIDSMRLEAETLGMGTFEIARQKAELDLLNDARQAGLTITDEVTAQIGQMATEYASATYELERMTEEYNFYKDTFSGFFSDLKSGLRDGQSLWEALGNAGANALDKIADRALSMAANGLFDMIFGAVLGGFSGGFGNPMSLGAGGPGFLGGGASAWGPSFDGGGFTGYGVRSGGIDGRGGFPAILHPNETVVDHTKTAANDSGGDIVISNVINVPAGTSADVAPAIAREVTKELRRQLPDAIERHNRNPLRRAG